MLLQPLSRGSVSINSPDPDAAPEIDPAYLTDPDGKDAERLRQGIRLCLEIAASPSLKAEIGSLVQPEGPLDDETVEAIASGVRPDALPPGRDLSDGR